MRVLATDGKTCCQQQLTSCCHLVCKQQVVYTELSHFKFNFFYYTETRYKYNSKKATTCNTV